MNKGFVLQSLACLLAVSCSVNEIETINPIPAENDVFYASLESDSKPDTKVYLDEVDEIVKILWNEKDQISIFNKSTLNQQYEFLGKTGDNAGFFELVSEESAIIDENRYVCAVYPYLSSTSLDDSGILTLTLPEEQTYKEKSFGPGANTMVSTTNGENNLLRFKNVCGYLVLQFYGTDMSVKSIKLEGRNEERLSGEATMTPAIGVDPTILMASTAGSSVTLTCDKAVKLEKTSSKAIEFWMVLPPIQFTQGITLTITAKNGTVYILETDPNCPITIERNKVLRLTAVEVGSIKGHPYVELGTGTKWATMNVGAKSEKEGGNLFAWGQTVPITDSNYEYTSGYNDVAAQWGGSWRMPTAEEWQSLIDNCTWTWDSSKGGMTVKGTNGNSIFLPAAGFYNPDLPGLLEGIGAYWSSTQGVQGAIHLGFEEGVVPDLSDYDYEIAMSVRPISD